MSKLLQSTKDAICAFVQSADEATVSRILPIVFHGRARDARADAVAATERATRPGRTRKRWSESKLNSAKESALAGIKAAGKAGANAQEIAMLLGVQTKEVVRPLRELVASKAIRRTGKARATRYFAR